MSKRTTSRFQPDHAGRHTPVSVHPGMVVSHVSHGMGDHVTGHAVPGNVARDGQGKNVNATPVHGGMVRITGTAEGAPTITTLQSIPDASNPCAADPSKPGKVLAPVRTSPGMRSRQGAIARSLDDPTLYALGQAIKDEAGRS
jgi:hypothetical protein